MSQQQDLASLVAQFEQACNNLTVNQALRVQAEQFLQKMETTPQPYEFCTAVLERLPSQLPRFHAANILRKAIVREWMIIPEQIKSRLASYIINYVIKEGQSLQSPVRNQLLTCYAMIVKLSWLAPESAQTKKEAMDYVQKLLQANDISVRIIGMSLLTTLISEFSGQANRTTQIGQSWEFHERCRVAFQSDLLPQCFEFALGIIREFASSNTQPQSNAASDVVVKTAIKLFNEVLTWDFSPFDQRSVLKRAAVTPKKKDLPSVIAPEDAYWKKALTNTDLVTQVVNLHMKYREDMLIPHLTLQSLVQICSVSQRSFENDNARISFINHIFSGMFATMNKSLTSSTGGTGHEVYYLSLCIFRVISNFGLQTMLAVPNFKDIMESLAAVTVQIIRLSANSFDEWFFDSLDHLLDAWSIIGSTLEMLPSAPQHVLSLVQSCCTNIFAAYLESKLKSGNSEDDEDEEDNEDEEEQLVGQLNALSVLARQDVRQSLSLLNIKLVERLSVLEQVLKSNASMDRLWNEIDCILQLAGYVIADESEGETPMIPYSINVLTRSDAQQGGNILFDLMDNILKYGEFEAHCITSGMTSGLSPYMGQRLMWLLSRWAHSYLLPNTSYYSDFSPALIERYGGGNSEQVRQLVSFLLRKILLNLFQWQGEPHLATATCKLLRTLVKNKTTCQYLTHIDAWKQMLASDKDTFTSMSNQQDEIKGSFMECLVIGCSYGLNEQELPNYLQQLLMPLSNHLSSIIERPEFNTDYQSTNVISQISYCIEKLTGVVRASLERNVKILFHFLTSNQILEKLVALLHKYHNHSSVVCLILQFFEACVKNQINILSTAESKHLCQACLELMKAYRKHNAGKTFTGALGSNAEEEQFLDVLTLIQIGTQIVSKDFLDFDDANKVNGSELDVSMVVFMGLHLLLPLITLEMLQFPKLCNEYFTLVTFMFEIYPEKAAELPPDLFQQLVSSIVFGMKHHKPKICRLSFEALGSMASHNVKHQRATFRQQEAHNPNLVTYLLENIFSLILFELFSDELVTSMSEALLPLIIWDESKYQQLVNTLVQKESGNPEKQQRLIEAFKQLTNGMKTPVELNRENHRIFADNMGKFLVNARTFMRQN